MCWWNCGITATLLMLFAMTSWCSWQQCLTLSVLLATTSCMRCHHNIVWQQHWRPCVTGVASTALIIFCLLQLRRTCVLVLNNRDALRGTRVLWNARQHLRTRLLLTCHWWRRSCHRFRVLMVIRKCRTCDSLLRVVHNIGTARSRQNQMKICRCVHVRGALLTMN